MSMDHYLLHQTLRLVSHCRDMLKNQYSDEDTRRHDMLHLDMRVSAWFEQYQQSMEYARKQRTSEQDRIDHEGEIAARRKARIL